MTNLENVLQELGIEATLEKTTETGASVVYNLKLVKVSQVKDLIKSKTELDVFFGKTVNIRYPIAPMTVSVEVAKDDEEPVQTTDGIRIKIGSNEKKDIYYDLADNPHLLIGGTTGSGKSNFLHILITSLMEKYSPQRLQFYMVDPKGTELSMYDNSEYVFDFIYGKNRIISSRVIPCLDSLKFFSSIMKFREKEMKIRSFRTFEEYQKEFPDEPRIVIIIDEFAELMSDQPEYDTKEKNFREDTIKALLPILRMGRAFGVHLIAATQRPSVDVVPAQIKANMSRMCFRVQSRVDSKVILDETGGETLAGKGAFCFKNSLGDVVFGQAVHVTNEQIKKILERPKQGKAVLSFAALDLFQNYKKKRNDPYFIYNFPFEGGIYNILSKLIENEKEILTLSEVQNMLVPYSQCRENIDNNIKKLIGWGILLPINKTEFKIKKDFLNKLEWLAKE